MRDMIRGISIFHPVDFERNYLMHAVDYAIKNKMTHIQLCGPIHNPQKGNVDGMTLYQKYARFNAGKDMQFIENTMAYLNEAAEKTSQNGVKLYMWHHELELPTGFEEVFPEVKNETGDVEVTHPIIRDFLENKLADFFAAYPKIDGLVLTLHETRIPLLKLKNQRLDEIGRVKYVTQILYETLKSLGKELIVRPFASIEEDYSMMMQAYEEISTDLMVMDKWTQFDWSLCLPHNQFYNKIKKNPLLVETDIFGEFFGKGRLPLMLKQHILDKFAYCEGHHVAGYCSRVDRAGHNPFGEVNEVNLTIMNAVMNGKDVDAEIMAFFKEKYPLCAAEMAEIMEPTEEILRKTIYLAGYYFSELSAFPSINHSKNHFYFEMMKENYAIASDEWFIPKNWVRGSIESVLEEKQGAAKCAATLYDKVCALEGKMEKEVYRNLWTKFANLKYATAAWELLTLSFYHYARYFESGEDMHRVELEKTLQKLMVIEETGKKELGTLFYCAQLDIYDDADDSAPLIPNFVRDIRENFAAEEKKAASLRAENGIDFVICGGAMEGHKLQKEVCFSDTYIIDGEPCRIPGNGRGEAWSTVSTHGWISYEVKVKPNAENLIYVEAGTETGMLNLVVTVGEQKTVFSEAVDGKMVLTVSYQETNGKDTVRIRFDRNSKHTPLLYSVLVK